LAEDPLLIWQPHTSGHMGGGRGRGDGDEGDRGRGERGEGGRTEIEKIFLAIQLDGM
jgi:hypothetical protein